MRRKRIIPEWGRRCKAQMTLNGLTLADVCEKTGYGRTYLSAIINGRVIVPPETAEKISKALDVDVALYPSL